MRHLLFFIISITVAGCTGHSDGLSDSANRPRSPRIGKVTEEMILADGGICDDDEVCYDMKSQQDYDCEVEFSCVPTNISPRNAGKH